MKTRLFFSVIALGFLLVATTQLFGVDGEIQHPVKKPVTWEYCEVSMLDQSSEAHMSFEGPDKSFKVVGFSEFADKLEMKGDAQNSTAFLNHLGSQGWELVTSTYASGRSGRRHTWLLKRMK